MDAGSIVYEVDIETREAIEASEKLTASVDKMDKSLNESERAAKGLKTEMNKTAAAVKKANDETSKASSSMKGFIAIIGAFLTLRAAQSIAQLSDVYGQMASRVRNATSSIEEYELVQSRLLETANGTYRSLSEAQEVYLATADVLRDLGYETSQVLDITDSLSYAFVRDAARADQARTAMDAYSKALIKGKIDADGWVSMMNATPSLIKGIAQATGESEATIRQLGVTGKLSIEALNEGLRRSRDENKAFADEMEVSTQDAFTKLTNSMTVFVGKMNESSGASSILTDNVALLADALQDPEVIKAAQDMAGGVVAAINGIITSTKEVVKFVQWMGEELAYTFKGAAASDDIVRLEQKLSDVRSAINNPSERIRFFGDGGVVQYFSRDELEAEAKLIQSQIDEYYKAIDSSSRRSAETTKEVAEVKVAQEKKVKAQIEETAKTSEKASSDLDKAAQNNIRVIHQLEQQLLLAALSGEALANAKAKASLNEFATPEEVERVRQLSSELYKIEQMQKKKKEKEESKKQSIRDQESVDPRFEAENRFKAEMETLTRLNNEKLIENQRFLELKTQMEAAHAEELKRIDEERFAAQSMNNQLLIDTMNHVHAAGTQAITGLLSGTNNLTDAMQQLGAGIMHSAVDSLVEMGVQWVKTMIMGKAAQTAAASAAAASGSAIATSYAPAASMVSLASYGANAIPAQTGIAATTAMAQGLAVAGGRQYGGPVEAGKMYRINENGAPEIYQSASGQQYMMPNSRGQVISNKDATGAGIVNNITINIDEGGSSTDSGNSSQNAKELANLMKTVCIQTITEQSRQGGVIWRQRQNGR